METKQKISILYLNESLKKVAKNSLVEMSKNIDINKLYDLIEKAIINRNPEESILITLRKINFGSAFYGYFKKNMKFNCPFFNERDAWIYQNNKGFVYYYSKLGDNPIVISFDIIGLLSILRNESDKEVFNFIEEHWNLMGVTSWYSNQSGKYKYNEIIIDDLENNKSFPYLNKILKNNIEFLSVFNEHSKKMLISEYYSVEDKNVFFASAKSIKENYFPQFSISKINGLINLLSILGFINKIPNYELPRKMQVATAIQHKKKQRETKHLLNTVSYFTVNEFIDIIVEAENRAEILIENRVYFHNLSKNVVKELFGMEIHDKVYVQKTYGNIGKHLPIYVRGHKETYTELERLTKLFNNRVLEKGFCELSYLKEQSIVSYKKFQRLWVKILRETNSELKTSTLNEVEFGVKLRSTIAMPIVNEETIELRSPQTLNIDLTDNDIAQLPLTLGNGCNKIRERVFSSSKKNTDIKKKGVLLLKYPKFIAGSLLLASSFLMGGCEAEDKLVDKIASTEIPFKIFNIEKPKEVIKLEEVKGLDLSSEVMVVEPMNLLINNLTSIQGLLTNEEKFQSIASGEKNLMTILSSEYLSTNFNSDDDGLTSVIQEVSLVDHQIISSFTLKEFGRAIDGDEVEYLALVDVNSVNDTEEFYIQPLLMVVNEKGKIISTRKVGKSSSISQTATPLNEESLLYSDSHKEFNSQLQTIIKSLSNETLFEQIQEDEITKSSTEIQSLTKQVGFKAEKQEIIFDLLNVGMGTFEQWGITGYLLSDEYIEPITHYELTVSGKDGTHLYTIDFNRGTKEIIDIRHGGLSVQ